MRILKNQDILQRQSENYVRGELSNIASVVQSQQVLTEYYSIDPDKSITTNGLHNIEEFIGPDSSVVYNKIENLPMGGINELVMQSTFDEEMGHTEDFQSEGIIFPNTIIPKENDFFIVQGDKYECLYAVTEIAYTTVRSNPFTQVQFRLYTRDPELIAQIRRQVADTYLTTVTAIGMDKSLVVKKENLFSIEKHVNDYLDILDLYKMLFYDHRSAAFIFDGIVWTDGIKWKFLDLVLWNIMFENRVGLFDEIVTYANNNFNKTVEQCYSSSPHQYVEPADIKRSIIYKLFFRVKKTELDAYKFPQANEPDPRVGKFTGKFLYYFERYGASCDCNPMCETCPVWDDEFVRRLKENDPYPNVEYDGPEYIDGELARKVNKSLRNAIIAWYNEKDIDWENLVIEQDVTSENYFLIPILLHAYRDFIKSLQK